MSEKLFRTANKNILLTESGTMVFIKENSAPDTGTIVDDAETDSEAQAAVVLATQEYLKIQGELKTMGGSLPSVDLVKLLELDSDAKTLISWVEAGVNVVSGLSTGLSALKTALQFFGKLESTEDKLFGQLKKIDRKLDEIARLIKQVDASVLASWSSETNTALLSTWAHMTTALDTIQNFADLNGDRNDPVWRDRLNSADNNSALAINTIIGNAVTGFCDQGPWRRPFSARLIMQESWQQKVSIEKVDFQADIAGAVWEYRWMMPHFVVGIVSRLLVLNVIYPPSTFTQKPQAPVQREILRFQEAIDAVLNRMANSIHIKNYQTAQERETDESSAPHHAGMWVGALCTATGQSRLLNIGRYGSDFVLAQQQCPNGDLKGWTPDICLASFPRFPVGSPLPHINEGPPQTPAEAALRNIVIPKQCDYARMQLLMAMPFYELCSLQNKLSEFLRGREVTIRDTNIRRALRKVQLQVMTENVSGATDFKQQVQDLKLEPGHHVQIDLAKQNKLGLLFNLKPQK